MKNKNEDAIPLGFIYETDRTLNKWGADAIGYSALAELLLEESMQKIGNRKNHKFEGLLGQLIKFGIKNKLLVIKNKRFYFAEE